MLKLLNSKDNIMPEYQINKGLILKKLGKKITFFDGEKSILFTFNETASVIFSMLQNNWNINKTAKYLTNKYKINLYDANKEIKSLLDYLTTKKIIRINN